MPIRVEFSASNDSSAGDRRIELFCDGVDRWDDPPKVETGTGPTPKSMADDSVSFYGIAVGSLIALDWTPRFVSYLHRDEPLPRVEAFEAMECDVTRSVVTLRHVRPDVHAR